MKGKKQARDAPYLLDLKFKNSQKNYEKEKKKQITKYLINRQNSQSHYLSHLSIFQRKKKKIS